MNVSFLGTAASIPSIARDTTSLVIQEERTVVLVDCGGSVVARLNAVGIDPMSITHIVVTHVHSDHVYGLPLLLDNFKLLGRTAAVQLLCHPAHTGFIDSLLSLFGCTTLGFAIRVSPLPLIRGSRFSIDSLIMTAAASDHGAMPCAALRFDAHSGAGIVYSSDTAPCRAVVELATGADLLIHEATFPHRDRGRWGTHSTAREAGEVAREAGVHRLLLAHVAHSYHDQLEEFAAEARAAFGGTVDVARELTTYQI